MKPDSESTPAERYNSVWCLYERSLILLVTAAIKCLQLVLQNDIARVKFKKLNGLQLLASLLNVQVHILGPPTRSLLLSSNATLPPSTPLSTKQ